MSDDAPATNLYQALLNAQRAMGPVLKNATNPHLRSKYADLGSVIDTIEQPLWDNGLLLVQRFQYDRIGLDGTAGEGTPILITELVHAASGERIESVIAVVSKDPTDPQKIGAAITYYRRYSLLALLGLAPEDDDGHAASQPRPQPAPARSQAARPAPPAGKPANYMMLDEVEAEIAPLEKQIRRNDDAVPNGDYARYHALDARRKELRATLAPPAAAPPVALTDEQEKVIAQAWDMADAKDSYAAVIALIRTLRAAATPEQWGAIKEAGHQIQLKHYAPASSAG